MTIFLTLVVILQFIVIIVFIHLLSESRATNNYYHSQWSAWENRWYKTQHLLMKEHNLILKIDGIKSDLEIEKH